MCMPAVQPFNVGMFTSMVPSNEIFLVLKCTKCNLKLSLGFPGNNRACMHATIEHGCMQQLSMDACNSHIGCLLTQWSLLLYVLIRLYFCCPATWQTTMVTVHAKTLFLSVHPHGPLNKRWLIKTWTTEKIVSVWMYIQWVAKVIATKATELLFLCASITY
jgi:hypothetical protein